MTRALASVIAGLLVALAGQVASADEFLEEPHARRGLMFGASIGPGAVVGNAGSEAGGGQGGGGGALALRLGTSAGPKLLWLVQLDAIGFVSKTDTSIRNVHSMVTLGAQYYLLDALWLQVGLGSAGLTENKKDPDTGKESKTEVNSGFGLMVSGGYELVRRGSWVVALESLVGLGIYDDGVVGQVLFRVGANHY